MVITNDCTIDVKPGRADPAAVMESFWLGSCKADTAATRAENKSAKLCMKWRHS